MFELFALFFSLSFSRVLARVVGRTMVRGELPRWRIRIDGRRPFRLTTILNRFSFLRGVDNDDVDHDDDPNGNVL